MITNKTFSSLFTLATLFTLFLLTACTSNEIGESKDVAQEKIYQEYSITYTEGNSNVDIFCQYRFGGKNGTTLVLNMPSEVKFDGEKLNVDSNGVSGAYYKANKPALNFMGKHSFVFTNIDKKQYENSFTFDDFKVTFPASASKNTALTIPFTTTALGADDYVEINTVDSDSSFSITNNGNNVIIPIEELKRQKKNDVQLEAHLYRNIPLQQNTTEGGKLFMHYTLKPVSVKLK
ncbi:MAG: hypothetical protein KA319_12580 [Ferruginibacter sp.]|nr:hypothetical protein [Ferruginibacter sp.]